MKTGAILLLATAAAASMGKAAGLASRADAVRPARHPAVQPSKDALSLAQLVRGRWLGIDAAGNLWAWEAVEGSIRFFSPTGERLGTLVIPQDTAEVDASVRFGAVALVDEGNRVVWLRPGTVPKSSPPAPPAPATPGDNVATPKKAAAAANEIRLSEPAGWVCWIDETTIALSPQRGPHRVELWNLRSGKLTRSFGTETPITLETGATRVREVQLRYDPARRLLYTLESYDGTLQVFTLEGALSWQTKVANPYVKVEEKTMADLDERAKARTMKLGRTLSDLWLGESADGTAWVSQRIDMVNKKVGLIKATAKGAVAVDVPDLRCPSRTFTIWGDHLLFFRDITSPREVCNSLAPLP
jgi:hypothetical protein